MGWLKGLGEVVGYQDGQVGVLALFLLIAVAVHHRQVVVVVFLRHKAAGFWQKVRTLFFQGAGVADQLGFVQNPVDLFHHLIAALHPHADVHRAGLVGDVVLGAQLFQPVGAAASGADHHRVRIDGLGLAARLADQHAPAYIPFQQDVFTLGGEQHLHPLGLQVFFHRQVQLMGLFGAQVADGAIHQLEAGLDGVLADLPDLLAGVDALHMGVGPEVQIDLVGVIDQLLGKVFPR